MAVIVDTDSAGRVRRLYYEEDEMTIDERAEETARLIISGNGLYSGAYAVAKQAITAAVEEEREACLKITNTVKAYIREQTYAAAYARSVVEQIHDAIRARSTASPADTEGERK